MVFIVVGGYHTRVATGQLRLKNGLGRDGEVSMRKYNTRKWSESKHKMAAIIWSQNSKALSFRTSALVRLVKL